MATAPVRQEEHGTLYKATKIGLGAASAAAFVMSFIPEVNLIGAVLQGGITVVETGMDLATKGPKKAAWTFAGGALLTGASVIPFLGAAGNTAKAGSAAFRLMEEGAAAAKIGSEAAESGGVLASISKAGGRALDAVKTTASRAWHGTGNAIKKIPGVDSYVIQPVSKHIVTPAVSRIRVADNALKETSLAKAMKGSRAAAYVRANPGKAGLAEFAAWNAPMPTGDAPPSAPDTDMYARQGQWASDVQKAKNAPHSRLGNTHA